MPPQHPEKDNSDHRGYNRQVVDQIGRQAALERCVRGSETNPHADTKSNPSRHSVGKFQGGRSLFVSDRPLG